MKAVIKLGYTDYILPASKALEILTILESADRWESDYHSSTEGKAGWYSYHAYPAFPTETEDKTSRLELVADDLYRIAKLAGRPEPKK